jgi:hypothetical protein
MNNNKNMGRIIFSFDFDGTITDIPGQESKLFHSSQNISMLTLPDVYEKLEQIYIQYLSEETCKNLKMFFEIIKSLPNSSITIQTNNYRNVVEACLLYHIKIPFTLNLLNIIINTFG